MRVLRACFAAGLALAFTWGFGGCLLGRHDCGPGTAECVGTTGAYRICSGGEGYYSWDDHQCPGLEPVCVSRTSNVTSCEDLAKPAPCALIATLLDVGAAQLSNVVDLERDGTTDLILGADLVSRSNGRGMFEVPHPLGLLIAGHVQQLLPADLNGDGIADVALSSQDPRELYAFFGSGGGNYALAQRYFVSAIPTLDAAVDLDGDGRDEIIGTSASDGVHLISGLGQLELSDRVIDTTSSAFGHSVSPVTGVLVADFDGKPPLDLAALGPTTDIYLTQSDGSHLRTQSFSDVYTAADLDGDGRADLASATRLDRDAAGVSIHFAGQDGAFARELVLPVPYPPGRLLVADFDGDGMNDLAVLLAGPELLLQVFLGNGDGSFRTAPLVSLPGDADVVAFSADVEHDGQSDLVLQAGSKVIEIRGACLR
jgi:hypothetical protein